MKILLVEDETELATTLERILLGEGYWVKTCGDGRDALGIIRGGGYDLLILDWMLPGISGLEICKQVRQCFSPPLADIPILFLTAKDTLDDRVVGLDGGADDYIVKPFELRELLARIRALLRRGKSRREGIITAGLEVDWESHLVYRNGRLSKLSDKEIQLLRLFYENPYKLITQEYIYNQLWGQQSPPSSNVVAAMVRLLRRKIESPDAPPLIHTVYGKGYWFGLEQKSSPQA
ncbi:MAG: response regulator transcription factor [Geminocystis sp.]|nr:response regulator transcription factor [Geminocystis sp.]HIK37073.1 response regulator transcription factor [Geminocystis sp. M7585_C2015_104]MCS7148969.1 response regulator transcription factor [Geminocystis sp.]MCX8077559.1 response regulator transcription factor [Geminocystis sp.]MDW8117184.1 response regulator transcription factor [Geminocystis sp.]